MKSREVPYCTIDIARVLPLKTWWFSIAIDCLLQMGYSYKASKNCMVGGDRRFEKRRCRTFGSYIPSGDWTFGSYTFSLQCSITRLYATPKSPASSFFIFFQCSPDWMIIKKNHQFTIWTRVVYRIAGRTTIRNLWWFWSEISFCLMLQSPHVWCWNPHMGVSENSVPLKPMVNDHYPY